VAQGEGPEFMFQYCKKKLEKNIYQAFRKLEKAGVAILMSERLDFMKKSVRSDKEGHYILMKKNIQQEGIKILNIYSLTIRAPTFIK
jgi:hypothetical protein